MAERLQRLRQRRAPAVVIAAVRRFSDANGMSRGAALAFYAAFSIAPMLVVVTSVMVWVLGDAGAQRAVLDALHDLVGEGTTRELESLLMQASERLQTATGKNAALFGSVVALVTTLVGSTAVFVEMHGALQAMIGAVPLPSSWWEMLRVRLVAAAIVIGCGFLLSIAMMVQAAALVALRWLAQGWPLLTPLLGVVEGLWSTFVIALIFAAMIRWLPDTRLPSRHALFGGAVAAVLFMLGRYAIGLYIAKTATQSALGAASSFAALLVWVYWSSQIFLFGAAVTVEAARPLSKPA